MRHLQNILHVCIEKKKTGRQTDGQTGTVTLLAPHPSKVGNKNRQSALSSAGNSNFSIWLDDFLILKVLLV